MLKRYVIFNLAVYLSMRQNGSLFIQMAYQVWNGLSTFQQDNLGHHFIESGILCSRWIIRISTKQVGSPPNLKGHIMFNMGYLYFNDISWVDTLFKVEYQYKINHLPFYDTSCIFTHSNDIWNSSCVVFPSTRKDDRLSHQNWYASLYLKYLTYSKLR